MTDTASDIEMPTSAWRGLPVWARVGILALAAIVVALIALVLIRLATRVPAIPLGTTAVEELRPGSCLAEDALDLDEYTVVSCGVEHPRQVFAVADLEMDESVYALAESSLDVFGNEVCGRYLEYRLFLVEDLEKGDFTATMFDVPSPDDYESGDTEGLCVIAAEDGGSITGDLYRPMP